MEASSLNSQLVSQKTTLKLIKGKTKKNHEIIKKGIINTLTPNFFHLNSLGKKVFPKSHVIL